jgi:uncharacterized protein YdaU (DUF1376 family)
MSKPADTWMPLYIGDYLADTMHLTHAQHGIYLLLIMAYWRAAGSLSNEGDQLAAVAKCSGKEWRRHRPIIEKFFHIEGHRWTHKRIDAELETAAKLTQERSKAGASGAAKRWEAVRNAIAKPSQTDAPSPKKESKNLTKPSLTEPLTAREESENFSKKSNGVLSGRCAPLSEKKRNLLISKVTRFATAKIADPEVAIAGLMGDDPEHGEQWWLDHLAALMHAQHWDDTVDRQDSAA